MIRTSAAWIGLAALLLLLPASPAQEAKARLLPRVSPELLEGVLKGLDLSFKKTKEKETVDVYTFERGDTKITLKNYAGEDLWIESVFDRKLTLTQANQWNASAKYTRCVLLDSDGKATPVLEMQLDCLKGVTDGMVRQFLVRFGSELKEFQKFAK